METFKKESLHFKILYFDKKDEQILNKLTDLLESKYKDLSKKLIYSIKTITVKIYPTIEKLHTALHLKNAPEWIVGKSIDNCIEVISPLAHHSIYNYNDIVKIFIHELVHLFINNISADTLPVFAEGLATYEADQNYLETAFTHIIDDSNGSYLNFSNFCSMKSNNKFLYAYSYMFTKFVINNYGYNIFILYLKDKNYFLNKGKFLYDVWIESLCSY